VDCFVVLQAGTGGMAAIEEMRVAEISVFVFQQ